MFQRLIAMEKKSSIASLSCLNFKTFFRLKLVFVQVFVRASLLRSFRFRKNVHSILKLHEFSNAFQCELQVVVDNSRRLRWCVKQPPVRHFGYLLSSPVSRLPFNCLVFKISSKPRDITIRSCECPSMLSLRQSLRLSTSNVLPILDAFGSTSNWPFDVTERSKPFWRTQDDLPQISPNQTWPKKSAKIALDEHRNSKTKT